MAKFKNAKTSISKLFYALVFIVLFLLSLSMIESEIALADNSLKFDNTSILDDLYNGTDEDGNVFDINDFPADKDGRLGLHSFVEYGYSYNDNQKNYALYLYIYNPQQIDFSQYADANVARIAVVFSDDGEATDYKDFKIRNVAKTTGEYNNLFYKFKILDPDREILTLAKNYEKEFGCRNYSIVGLFLKSSQSDQTYSITVEHTYKCSGFMSGYGKNESAPSTFSCKAEALETLDIPVYQTSYITGVSDLGAYHHYNVSSVYFAIPDRIFKEYGFLAEIFAQWYECKSAPILVTSNSDFYTQAMAKNHYYLADNKGEIDLQFDKNVNYVLCYGRDTYSTNTTYREDYQWAYNVRQSYSSVLGMTTARVVHTSDNMLPFVFYSPSYTDYGAFNVINKQTVAGDVTSSVLKDYVINYQSGNSVSWHPYRELAAELFVNEVDKARADKGIKVGLNQVRTNLNDTFDLNSFDSEFSTWWDRLAQYGWSYPRDGALSESHKNVLPFEEITANKLSSQNIATDLLINEYDVESFINFCNQSLKDGLIPYLFRFAVSDYYSRPVERKTGDDYLWVKDSYIAQETMFFDFNIITMSFNKNEAYFTLPVMHDPLDVLAGVVAPDVELNPGEQIVDKTLTAVEKIANWFNEHKNKIIKAVVITAIVIGCIIFAILVICIVKKMMDKKGPKPKATAAKPAKSRTRKKLNTASKISIIVFVLIFLILTAVGLWHHWPDITSSPGTSDPPIDPPIDSTTTEIPLSEVKYDTSASDLNWTSERLYFTATDVLCEDGTLLERYFNKKGYLIITYSFNGDENFVRFNVEQNENGFTLPDIVLDNTQISLPDGTTGSVDALTCRIYSDSDSTKIRFTAATKRISELQFDLKILNIVFIHYR